MIDWEGFLAYFDRSEPALEAWGRHVVSTIEREAAALLDDHTALQMACFRVKEKNSAIGKVATKGYTDPVNQMTDLVGARIVVLLSSHLDVVSQVIENSDYWHATVDRDPSDEIFKNPNLFDYQSKHFMLRAKPGIGEIGGVDIPEALPCEVQVRTILQHAFAEVVHDKIYKTDGIVPVEAKRHCASSMALMETADHLLCETMRKIEEINRPTNDTLQGLTAMYAGLVGPMDGFFDPKLNNYILDNLQENISAETITEIAEILKNNITLVDAIRERRERHKPFWSQPISLLAYWYVKRDRRKALYDWPVASFRDDIQQIYSDLGIATPR